MSHPPSQPAAPKGQGDGDGDTPDVAMPSMVAQIDLALIHRVLLTDPDDIDKLSVRGTRKNPVTMSFADFIDAIDKKESVEFTMKAAFRDGLCERILDSQNLEPARDLLLDLYSRIRALIPSRTDLHSLLQDSDVSNDATVSELVSLAKKAAKGLSQLESEARSISTQAWLSLRQVESSEIIDRDSVTHLITSLMYLHYKAELCELDKQDFYLQRIWAPQILQTGVDMERDAFQNEFGPLSHPGTAPATRAWIQELIASAPTEGSAGVSSSEYSKSLVEKGWVETILFRKTGELRLPEIFAQDVSSIQHIRQVTGMATAGSALALVACQVASQPSGALQNIEPSSAVDLARDHLVKAMGERLKPRDIYERDVADSVKNLALQWNPSLNEDDIAGLRNRAMAVLRGEDPVLQLLDSRMKNCFLDLISTRSTSEHAVPTLRSGISTTSARSTDSRRAIFVTKATAVFQKHGLTFYASDLALAAYMAAKVVKLAWSVFGAFLEAEIARCRGSLTIHCMAGSCA